MMTDLIPANGYASFNPGRKLNDPNWFTPLDTERPRVQRHFAALNRVCKRTEAKFDSDLFPGHRAVLWAYIDEVDRQVQLEVFGNLDAPLEGDSVRGTVYRGWELEYHPNGYGYWPELKWTATDPNGEGKMLVDRGFMDICLCIDYEMDD